MSGEGAVCLWHTFSAGRNEVQTPLLLRRDPEACGRQVEENAACEHIFFDSEQEDRTTTKKAAKPEKVLKKRCYLAGKERLNQRKS